jgi:hypothetical protein
MRNGDDYYIIDMALAENSALNDCVPREKLRPYRSSGCLWLRTAEKGVYPMDAIKYLDADTILDYLHNSSETYLEGLIPQSHGFPPETDRSVYVRLLKVPVRDKASEVYMQAIPYKMFEGDSNRPIEEFGKDTKFEKVGVIIDSSRLWLMELLWRICTQSRQKFDDADFVSEFWDAFTRKVLKEYAVDARVEKSETVKNLAKQYAILDMLSKHEKPVYFGCIENALQTYIQSVYLATTSWVSTMLVTLKDSQLLC